LGKSLRPYVTAGIALVGASVLAVAPVIATPRDMTIANPDVARSASPIDPYLAIFASARTNAEALLEAAVSSSARKGTSREKLHDSLFGAPAANFHDVLDATTRSSPSPAAVTVTAPAKAPAGLPEDR
jgi:hypothetical protein